jgi:uroporphyrinogen-III synthase
MTIYISKKIEDTDYLSFMAENNLELSAVSMISFKSTIFAIPKEEEFDAVFFTSPRSVLFFLEKVELSESTFIGAIGKSTASFVHQQGYSVHFTGIQSGKPKEVAESFKAVIGDRKVLFPQSSRSKKSIQALLKPVQCIDLVVYETLLEPVELKNSPEILVFTSPSNVEAFLLKNSIDKNQKIIAWGNSTALYLEKIGSPSSEVLEKSNFEELKIRLQKMVH